MRDRGIAEERTYVSDREIEIKGRERHRKEAMKRDVNEREE